MSTNQSDRRGFLKQSAAAAGTLAAVTRSAAAQTKRPAANSTIRIGVLGPGSRGFGAHVKRLTKLQQEGQPIELVALADVYNEHRDRAADYIEKQTGRGPAKTLMR